VQVAESSQSADTLDPPERVARLKARDAQQQQRAYETYQTRPVSAGDSLMVGGLMWTMLALGLCGLIMPVRAIRRWRGGWRAAATVPAALMLFAVLRLLVGMTRDPTSHNLWPFEILIAGVVNVVIILILTALRKAAEPAID
jgi:hypothetical protein